MAKRNVLDMLANPILSTTDSENNVELGEGVTSGSIIDSPTPLNDVRELSLNDRLEEAANLLLEQFQPSVKLFAMEVADIVLKIPRWQLLVGSMLAQHESGCLPAPSIDPSWAHERTDNKRTCKFCGQEFSPFKPFQDYCTNSCGVASRGEEKPSGMAVAHA